MSKINFARCFLKIAWKDFNSSTSWKLSPPKCFNIVVHYIFQNKPYIYPTPDPEIITSCTSIVQIRKKVMTGEQNGLFLHHLLFVCTNVLPQFQVTFHKPKEVKLKSRSFEYISLLHRGHSCFCRHTLFASLSSLIPDMLLILETLTNFVKHFFFNYCSTEQVGLLFFCASSHSTLILIEKKN